LDDVKKGISAEENEAEKLRLNVNAKMPKDQSADYLLARRLKKT